MSGCCSPQYRKSVNDEEEKINRKGKDNLPLSAKMFFTLVTAGALVAIYFIY